MSESKVRRLIVGDRTYLLEGGSPLSRLAEWEGYIATWRENPFDALSDLPAGTDLEIQKTIATRAFERWAKPMFVSAEEAVRFDNSVRGKSWSLWAALQVHHADEFPDVESAARLLAELTQSDLPTLQHGGAEAPAITSL